MLRRLPRFVTIALAAVLYTTVAPVVARADYTDDYIAAYSFSAQTVRAKYGVPASVALAQSILETGWGRSSLNQKANNFFGIKCSSSYVSPYQSGCYSVSTQEYYPDTGWTTIVAPFRRYVNSTNSFLDYGMFLTTNGRYANAFNYKNDYRRFIIEVHKAGYATDPNYSTTIIRIIEGYQLWRFDGIRAVATPLADDVVVAAPLSPDPLVNSTETKQSAAQILGVRAAPTPTGTPAPAVPVPPSNTAPEVPGEAGVAAVEAGSEPSMEPAPVRANPAVAAPRPLANTGI